MIVLGYWYYIPLGLLNPVSWVSYWWLFPCTLKFVGKHLTLGNTYHCWQSANYASDISSRGTDITSEMCSAAHISRGNIYHCNTGAPKWESAEPEWFVLQLVIERPGIYLPEICRELQNSGTDASIATICRFLQKCGFTRTKIQAVALQQSAELRQINCE